MNLAEHDSKTVAELIAASAPELFQLTFGSKALELLSRLIERSHNRFSHRYLRVAVLHGAVIGVVALVPSEQLLEQPDYDSLLTRPQRLRLHLINRFILPHVLRHHYPPHSLYIGNLSVASKYQNQGIGSQLLARGIAETEQNHQKVFISVNLDNVRAQKLYERLGFELVETKAIRLLGQTVGSRVLVRSHQTHQATP